MYHVGIWKDETNPEVSLLLMSSNAAEIPQNLHVRRKQENPDRGTTWLPSLTQVDGLSQSLANKNLFLSTEKMELKEMWGRS